MTAPEVLITPLSQKESERLLRRYRLARRVFGGQVHHRQTTKQLQYLSSIESTYRVNLGWLQEQFEDGHYTWESFWEEADLALRSGHRCSLIEIEQVHDKNTSGCCASVPKEPVTV